VLIAFIQVYLPSPFDLFRNEGFGLLTHFEKVDYQNFQTSFFNKKIILNMDHRVLLLLGAGLNVGLASITAFKAQGFKVASVSRNPSDAVQKAADLVLTADFSDPSCIADIFSKVETKLGIPNVVIYNGNYLAPQLQYFHPFTYFFAVAFCWEGRASDPAHPTTAPLAGFQQDLAVNTTSPYAAAQAAVAAFSRLPGSVLKTFIFTGNKGAAAISPPVFTLCLAKAATWYMIQTLVAAYKDQGYRFYFADERTPDGKGMIYISGEAHAEIFIDLAQREEQGEAFLTFVRGKGEVRFEADERAKLPVLAPNEMADFGYGKPDEVEGVRW
jgi:NAD(P)-dependent dehydrogenase (short-subunit alcohol dehydrogenase family)